MVRECLEKVKEWTSEHRADLFTAAVIFLASMASFGLGRLSVIWPEKEPIRILEEGKEITGQVSTPQESRSPKAQTAAVAGAASGKYVASKSGTAYHLPNCPGAAKIKESNKVWFQTREEAEERGYKPAANCPGLQ